MAATRNSPRWPGVFSIESKQRERERGRRRERCRERLAYGIVVEHSSKIAQNPGRRTLEFGTFPRLTNDTLGSDEKDPADRVDQLEIVPAAVLERGPLAAPLAAKELAGQGLDGVAVLARAGGG